MIAELAALEGDDTARLALAEEVDSATAAAVEQLDAPAIIDAAADEEPANVFAELSDLALTEEVPAPTATPAAVKDKAATPAPEVAAAPAAATAVTEYEDALPSLAADGASGCMRWVEQMRSACACHVVLLLVLVS
jgi:hypothetical protein